MTNLIRAGSEIHRGVNRGKKNGFTFVEILVVVIIVAISIVFYKTVFLSNWSAFDERLIRDNLWQESNVIIETITNDARKAHQINIDQEQGDQSAVLIGRDNNTIATYIIKMDGSLLIINDAGAVITLSEHVDVVKSSFAKQGNALYVTLSLKDQLFNKEVVIQTTSEIYPRN